MKIDNKLLTKLETLSSVKIESKNREKIISQLSEVVSFVKNLNELDLKNQDPNFIAIEGGTPLREDVPSKDEKAIKTTLESAPNIDRNFFVVPAIIE